MKTLIRTKFNVSNYTDFDCNREEDKIWFSWKILMQVYQGNPQSIVFVTERESSGADNNLLSLVSEFKNFASSHYAQDFHIYNLNIERDRKNIKDLLESYPFTGITTC